MTIASEIIRIKTAVADAYTACQEMGATMPAVLNSDNLEQCIASITVGPVSQGRFVAASAAKIAYSDDGLTWTEIDNTSGANYICYGDGKFVGVKFNSNTAIYSTDGINWNTVTLPTTNNWASIAYGDNKFVAVPGGDATSSTAIYSTDGINWDTTTLPITKWLAGLSYGNNKFITAQNSTYGFTKNIYYSTDVVNWSNSQYTSRNDVDVWRISFGNNKFVIVARKNGTYCTTYSSDALTWSALSELPRFVGNLYSANNKFFGTSNSNEYVYSEDGIEWSLKTFPSTLNGSGVAYNGEKYVAIGYNTDIYMYSTDGINWTQSTLPSSQPWSSIAYGEVQ